MTKVLGIEDLTIHYATPQGPLQALRHVDLAIEEGEILGLVGESGCGKSTLISAILRLLSPNADVVSGRVLFDGRDILRMPENELRKLRGDSLSIVFQDPMTSFNPVLTIGRQLTDFLYREKASASDKRRKIVDALRRVGIADPEDRFDCYPHELSGGMRQRVAIAAALMSSPRLLIADEPTTALDATTEMQIVALFRKLREQFRGSMLFVSHHLGVVATLCDRIAVMYAGEVVEQGSVEDVFNRPAHPYTQALLRCDPARLQNREGELPTIPGNLPDLVKRALGCAYAERCGQAIPRCRKAFPAPRPARTGHLASCHLVRAEEGHNAVTS